MNVTTVLRTPQYHMVGPTIEGGDPRLRGSPDTDHLNHGVIIIIQSH